MWRSGYEERAMKRAGKKRFQEEETSNVQPRDMNELGCLRNRKRHMWLEARNRAQTVGCVDGEGGQIMWVLRIFILC